MTEYKQHIAEVAQHYWGEPNRALSKAGKEIRFGSHGSKSVDLVKGTWFDHEQNVGGGVADLIKSFEPNTNIADKMAQFGMPKNDAPVRTERVWNYTDETGNVAYQVVRIDDGSSKTYRQRRVDQETGEILWGMQGVTALPYNLPALRSSTKPVFIVEGEKCADALISAGLIATTNHGGAGKWWPSLTQHFNARNVIIVPDNDAPGEKHARIVADALTGTAKSIRILRLPFLKPKGDVADWMADGGTVEEITGLAKKAPLYDPLTAEQHPIEQNEPIDPAQKPRVELIPWEGLQDVPVKWLIKELVPAQSFAALYGKPGSYKSFVALYLATMIATGQPAFDKETAPGDVIYLAGEGGSGLKARRDALIKKYDIDGKVRIHFIKAQLNLRSTVADLEALIAAIQDASLKPVLIIIDTLARAFGGGNENSSEDMGAFIGHIGQLQARLTTAVMIVHHSGKDEAKGQRGHSSLLGAVDTELEVIKVSEEDSPDRIGQLTITKQKDGEDGIKIGYRMDSIQLSSINPDRTSLAVVPAEIEPKQRKARLSPGTKAVLDALQKAIDEGGQKANLAQIPAGQMVVKVGAWRATYYAMSGQNDETKQKAFKRALDTLTHSRTIGVWSDWCWIAEA